MKNNIKIATLSALLFTGFAVANSLPNGEYNGTFSNMEIGCNIDPIKGITISEGNFCISGQCTPLNLGKDPCLQINQGGEFKLSSCHLISDSVMEARAYISAPYCSVSTFTLTKTSETKMINILGGN